MAPTAMLLGGRYQLDDRIAVGGMGEVWRATDLVLGRAVAVKLLHAGCAGSQHDRARFRAEARHAGSLSHPGIARVYDYCEAAPPYLVMELVDGPSLAGLLEEGPVGPARTMGLISQAAAALQAAHAAGLVHRDIKPGNLLVTKNGDVKVTDFGIAYAAGSASITGPGTLIGTPAYLAPERAAGAPATPAADLYALGIVAYQCLTGRLPFSGEPLAVALAHLEQPVPPLPPHVPAGVAALVADLTAKDPRARPASAGEVGDRADQLRTALTGAAVGPLGRSALLAGPQPSGRGRRGPAGSGLASTRQLGKPKRRVLGRLNAVLVLAISAVVIAAGWVIAGGSGPETVRPAATSGPGPAGSHSTHGAASARQTGGATDVVQPATGPPGNHGRHRGRRHQPPGGRARAGVNGPAGGSGAMPFTGST